MRSENWIKLVAGVALAGALCLPLAAQGAQNNAASQSAQPAAQPASNQAGTSQTQPTTGNAAASGSTGSTAEMQPLGQPPKQGFWGRVNPFARKKYVNNQLQPIRDRVNELDGLTAQNTQATKDLDARSQAAISQAQQQADQATQTANSAQQAVQQDATQATQLNQRYDATNRAIQNVDQYQVTQTAELNFNRGAMVLSPDAQQQLDGFVQGLDNQKGYVIEVTAYSPLHGQAGVDNSQRLADVVVRYLVLQHNLPLYRIYEGAMGNATAPQSMAAESEPAPATGMAPAATPSASAGPTAGGTVQIQILRNQTNSAGSGDSSGQ